MINQKYFEKIKKSLNFIPTVDLFATRLNTQLPHFISCRSDPESKGVNAFTLSWENLSFYAFMPFICIPMVLQKVWHDKAEGILKWSLKKLLFLLDQSCCQHQTPHVTVSTPKWGQITMIYQTDCLLLINMYKSL